MTLLPYEAKFPALGTRAVVLTSLPETLLPAVEVIRAELDVFGDSDAIGGHPMLDEFLGTLLDGVDPLQASPQHAEFDARSRIARKLADLLAEEFPGGFLVDLGATPAVAGESLSGPAPDIAESGSFSPAA